MTLRLVLAAASLSLLLAACGDTAKPDSSSATPAGSAKPAAASATASAAASAKKDGSGW